jgi:hypothetical protein
MINLRHVTDFQLNSNQVYVTLVDHYRVAVFIPLFYGHILYPLSLTAIGVPHFARKVLVDRGNCSVINRKRVYPKREADVMSTLKLPILFDCSQCIRESKGVALNKNEERRSHHSLFETHVKQMPGGKLFSVRKENGIPPGKLL